MWTNDDRLIQKDTTVVDKDFIFTEGTGIVVSSILNGENNPFGRDFFTPIFYTWKVHEENPMRIASSGRGHFHVYPVSKKTEGEMPARIYEDKERYDCSMFALAPYDVSVKDTGWRKWVLKDGFSLRDGGHLDASLLYADHGLNIHTQDSLVGVAVMPSQLTSFFGNWLMKNPEVYTHSRTFEQVFEGRFDVSVNDNIKQLHRDVVGTLEQRYNTRLSFFD